MRIVNTRPFAYSCLAACLVLVLAARTAAQTKTAQPETPKTRIRCITAFVRLDRSSYQLEISEATKFLKIAQTTFESRGFTVETLRIATQPFPEYLYGLPRDEALQFFKNLDGLAQIEKVIISIGPAYLAGDDGDAQADLLRDILENSKSLYGTVNVTNNGSVNWPAVRAAARVMKHLADGTAHSEGNFRFAALASVPQATPFFPGAYLTGLGHQFAVGLESADEVADAVHGAADLPDAKRRLIDLFFQLASRVENVATRIDSERGWTYLGLDLSPAPSKDASIVTAIENMSHAPLGSHGTLSAIAVITSAIKEIGLRKTGYSGIMLPVLEDSVLAERWNAGLVSTDALLNYSSVCGTGLDTIPLPGNVTEDALSRIIGDVATLSGKWNKPLTARLMPVAGRSAGERTDFSETRFLNAVIQPVSGPEPQPGP